MSSTGRGRRLAAFLLAITLIVTVTGAGIGVGATPSDAESDTQFQLNQQTPTNNTTRHEHPDRVSGQQDLASARRWLAGRMGTRLESCVVEVGRGSTNVCEFEDEYPDWLRKYVDIAEETDDEDDDRRAEVFDQTKEDHREYSRSVSNFTQTYEEYRAAKAAGDDERARALARALQRDAAEVTRRGEHILQDYRVIEGEAGVSLDDGKTSVNETVRNVSETVAVVEAAEFIRTVLRADLTPRAISFLDPGTVTGRLTTENGSGVANRTIDLRIGDRELTTRTDESGRFTLEYRPTTILVSTDELVVRYQPRAESLYLGNRTTVPVSIAQVEPTVGVSLDTQRAAFGDEVLVTGTVSADGIEAPGVPVRVVVDGRHIGTVRTDEAGEFASRTTILAPDGPGEVDIRAVVALDDRALASAVDTAVLTIEPTPTTLVLEAAETESPEITVGGRLTTQAGAPVPNQPVTLLVNGTPVESVRTDADGTYRTRLSVPSSLLAEEGNATIGVAARFEGPGTNLEPSSASAVLTLQETARGSSAGVVQPIIDSATRSPLDWALSGLVVGLVLLLLYFRERLVPGWVGDGRRQPQSGETEAVPESSTEPEPDATPTSPFAPARTRLDTEPDSAVMLAYATVRDRLAQSGRPQGRSAETHWEFLAACRQNGLDADAIDELTALTETYEAAAYAPVSVSAAEAEAALDSAERLVG